MPCKPLCRTRFCGNSEGACWIGPTATGSESGTKRWLRTYKIEALREERDRGWGSWESGGCRWGATAAVAKSRLNFQTVAELGDWGIWPVMAKPSSTYLTRPSRSLAISSALFSDVFKATLSASVGL